jgi:hypothetical protein
MPDRPDEDLVSLVGIETSEIEVLGQMQKPDLHPILERIAHDPR